MTDDTEARWAALLAAELSLNEVDPIVVIVITACDAIFGYTEMYSDPGRAKDGCIDASEFFAERCTRNGLIAELVSGFLMGPGTPPFEDIEVIKHGHTAAKVWHISTPIVVDWTARQYDPSAPVPLIVPLSAWQAFWVPLP